MFFIFPSALILLTSAIAVANPVPVDPAVVYPPMEPGTTFVAPEKVIIGFPDGTMNWGDQNPVTVLQQLYTKCSNVTNQCDPNPFSVQATVPASPEGTDTMTITLNIQESIYPDGLLNDLLDALIASANATVKNTPTQYDPTLPCEPGPGCYYQPDQTIDQYTFPTAIEISIPNPTNADAEPTAVISIGVTEVTDTGPGFCSTFSAISGAVGGAISGATGGFFSLLNFACMPN